MSCVKIARHFTKEYFTSPKQERCRVYSEPRIKTGIISHATNESLWTALQILHIRSMKLHDTNAPEIPMNDVMSQKAAQTSERSLEQLSLRIRYSEPHVSHADLSPATEATSIECNTDLVSLSWSNVSVSTLRGLNSLDELCVGKRASNSHHYFHIRSVCINGLQQLDHRRTCTCQHEHGHDSLGVTCHWCCTRLQRRQDCNTTTCIV
jgi:hypothetical protein